MAVNVKAGQLKGVRFIRNKLGDMDASGRQRPVPIPGSEFDVELDRLIVAISEEPDLAGMEGLAKTRWGTLAANAESYATDRDGVFAGGDVVFGPSTIIGAVAAGKNAAVMIDRYVKGGVLKVLSKVTLPSVYIQPVQAMDEDDAPTARVHQPDLPVEKRRCSFAEVELCLEESAAIGEAKRCLRCDLDFTQPD